MDEIGRGTHGVVKCVEHRGRIMAVKVYREFPVIPPEAMNEILIYKSTRECTVTCYDLIRNDYREHLYIELCKCNLRQLMDIFEYEERLEWIYTHWLYLYTRLEKLHSFGWTHGDISPLNILLDNENRPYFCDFGMSNPPIAGARYGGSMGFKAPLTEHKHFCSDWWSLGATLYYFLTGIFFVYEFSDITMLPEPVQNCLNINHCKIPVLKLPHEKLGTCKIPDDIVTTLNVINKGLSIEISQLAADIIRRYSSHKEVTLAHYPVALEIASKFITRTSLVSDSSGDYEEFRLIELDILEVLDYQLLTINFVYR